MMLKVMMAAPFEVRGRYKGGISSIANAVEESKALLNDLEIELMRFETCRVNRGQTRQSAFSVENIRNLIKIYKDLPKEIKSKKAECLYFHSSVKLALLKDLICIRRAKRKTKVPVVLHVHFADYKKIMTGKAVLDSLILKLMKKYVDQIVFLSDKTKAEFISQGIDADRCQVIYNFSTLEYTQEQIERKLNTSKSNTRFLFVGSIDKRKGIFDVLECITDLTGDYQLHVCGGFNNKDDEALFDDYKNKLGNKLIYHGYVSGEEKNRIFLDSDVLILPSYGEGLPVVILEALSAACGVVTTNVGAIPEIIGDENGKVITSGDTLQLRKALSFYIEAEDSLLVEQKAINYSLSKKYTIDNFVKSLGKVCRKATGTL